MQMDSQRTDLRSPGGGMVAEGWPGSLGLLYTGWTNSKVLLKGMELYCTSCDKL